MSVLVVDYELDAIEVVRLTFNLRWPEAEAMSALTARHDEVDEVRGLEPRHDPAGAPMIVRARGVSYTFVRRDRAPSRAGG